MNRITACFESRRKSGKKVLIPYLMAGDPNPDATVELAHQLVSSGADIIELGVPFSDPMADGPVIQKAAERALHYKVSLRDVLGMVETFRSKDQDTPIVLMGYLNPIEVMGYENFARAARDAGVDGVLTVDLPPEEAKALQATLRQHELDPIYLLAPTTDETRIRLISDAAGGYLYYVSFKGVTGAKHLDIKDVSDKLIEIRKITNMPIAVGFGIKDAESAAKIATVSDAVVVGSAIVSRIENNLNQIDKVKQSLNELVSAMRQAMDEATAV